MEPSLVVARGQIHVYHLFTLADTVDLEQLRRSAGLEASVSPFTSRRPTPEYIQFQNPPLTLNLGMRAMHPTPDRTVSARVTAKVFDFGVLTIRWTVPCPGSWAELVELAGSFIDNPALEVLSRQVLEELRPRLESALTNPPRDVLFEDYTIFYVQEFDPAMSAEAILAGHAASLAQLMRGERKPLSHAEQNEVLRQRVSYFEDDLAVIDWNTAFIYDREGGTEHVDTLEFANAELLELRFYDRLLDEQLDEIYQAMQRGQTLPRWRTWLRNHPQRTLERVMALTLDIVELTEQIENALKFIGDLYSARIYRAIAEKLRLREWEGSIDDKVRIAQQVYSMLTEQVDTRRSFILELIVVLLIALEILVAFGHR